jgi:hypothetical protein
MLNMTNLFSLHEPWPLKSCTVKGVDGDNKVKIDIENIGLV